MGILSSSSNSINIPVPVFILFIYLFIKFYETDKDYYRKYLII